MEGDEKLLHVWGCLSFPCSDTGEVSALGDLTKGRRTKKGRFSHHVTKFGGDNGGDGLGECAASGVWGFKGLVLGPFFFAIVRTKPEIEIGVGGDGAKGREKDKLLKGGASLARSHCRPFRSRPLHRAALYPKWGKGFGCKAKSNSKGERHWCGGL